MSNLEQYIRDLEKTPLSFDDLKNMSSKIYFKGNKPRILYLLYDNIPNKNINKIMENYDSLVILYQMKTDLGSSVGHYACITKIAYNKYSHFDSFGISVNDELKITHNDPKKIKNLLKDIDYDENHVKLQRYSSDVNTCGLFVLFRSLFFSMNNSQFIDYIKSIIKKIEPDDLVTLIYRFLLLK